jgi:hypothetical protein
MAIWSEIVMLMIVVWFPNVDRNRLNVATIMTGTTVTRRQPIL